MKTEKNYYDFLFLLTGDAALSRTLTDAMTESDTHPEKFFAGNYGRHFATRGVDNPGHPRQTLLFMLDELIDRDFVAELDWKADAEELNEALRAMSHGAIDEDLLSGEDEADADGMFELIEIAEELLEAKGYGILQLDIESDSHPIALVKLNQLERLDEMAGELFYSE